ncbi:MAG: hypothetical protein LE180_06010 [Endomicrobium sp.]|uniref:hypothetical protein n=1 Tax=Candidatus Endomicrobiellum pyrsonymphae TaxID=1408203 RepID=UPI0035836CA4|nr:hypothetical protein [Endomicrobium sp.]
MALSKDMKSSYFTRMLANTSNLARQYFSFESNKLGDIANATGVEVLICGT